MLADVGAQQGLAQAPSENEEGNAVDGEEPDDVAQARLGAPHAEAVAQAVCCDGEAGEPGEEDGGAVVASRPAPAEHQADDAERDESDAQELSLAQGFAPDQR